MPNERLRTAMLERGITPADLAEALKVDPKSVERWISGRTPYRRHRYAVAAHLGIDEVYLWPDALGAAQVASASESEIINIYPHRWAVPSELWRNVFNSAQRKRKRKTIRRAPRRSFPSVLAVSHGGAPPLDVVDIPHVSLRAG